MTENGTRIKMHGFDSLKWNGNNREEFSERKTRYTESGGIPPFEDTTGRSWICSLRGDSKPMRMKHDHLQSTSLFIGIAPSQVLPHAHSSVQEHWELAFTPKDKLYHFRCFLRWKIITAHICILNRLENSWWERCRNMNQHGYRGTWKAARRTNLLSALFRARKELMNTSGVLS